MNADPSKANDHARLANFAVGAGLLLAATAGVALASNETIDVGKTIIAIAPEHAQPSDGLAAALDLTIAAGALIGAGAIAKRGAHYVSISFSEKGVAIHKMAHAEEPTKRKFNPKVVGAASLLAVAAATMAGDFADIAHAAADSQSSVAKTLTGTLDTLAPHQGESFVLTNIPKPELAVESKISKDAVNKIMSSATKFNVDAMPLRLGWHMVYPDGKNKVNALAAGFPKEVVDLITPAKADCSNVEVLTVPSMGYKKGDSFNMDGPGGLRVTVAGMLDGEAGAGLLPVAFENDDFSRCLDNNFLQSYSAVLARGNRQDVIDLMKSQGLDGTHPANRVFMNTLADYMNSTQKTGENNAYPYVLPAIIVGLMLGTAALSGRARTRIITNLRVNTVDEANGTPRKIIRQKELELAESEAVVSGLVAVPLVVLVDAFSNTSIPGGRIGPELTTLLFAVGSAWTANRLGTSWAIRREAKNTDFVKGHDL
jgi:hypothetical protein